MATRVSRNEMAAKADMFRRADTAQNVAANRANEQTLHGTGANLFGPIRSSIGRGMIRNVSGDRTWDAWFQALRDRGVDRMAGGSLPLSPGSVQATGMDNSSAFGLPAWVQGGDIQAAMRSLQKGRR